METFSLTPKSWITERLKNTSLDKIRQGIIMAVTSNIMKTIKIHRVIAIDTNGEIEKLLTYMGDDIRFNIFVRPSFLTNTSHMVGGIF
jgi:hypothetical protein